MKRKIGVDLTYIKDTNVSGIKKHGEELIDGLIKYKNNSDEIVLFVYKHLKEEYKKKFPKCRIVTVTLLFRNIKYIRRINIYQISKIPKLIAINKEKCDIVIYPFSDKLTPIIKKQNKIVEILDIIPLDILNNQESNEAKKIKSRYLKIMNKSKYISTLSQYSKKRLCEINSNYKGNIIVIPSTIVKPENNDKKIEEVIGSKSKYIFSMNSFYKHKNQITLIKAFDLIKDKIPHILVLVGRPELDSEISGYNDVIKYIKERNMEDRVKILSFISDEERNCLFYNADLFVSTSTQEGFGRTPVESAMCNIPVISSIDTSLKEATMGLVNYYEKSTDERNLADKMLEVLNKNYTIEELNKIAEKLEKEYSEENISKKYFNLIDTILKEIKNG